METPPVAELVTLHVPVMEPVPEPVSTVTRLGPVPATEFDLALITVSEHVPVADPAQASAPTQTSVSIEPAPVLVAEFELHFPRALAYKQYGRQIPALQVT